MPLQPIVSFPHLVRIIFSADDASVAIYEVLIIGVGWEGIGPFMMHPLVDGRIE